MYRNGKEHMLNLTTLYDKCYFAGLIKKPELFAEKDAILSPLSGRFFGQ